MTENVRGVLAVAFDVYGVCIRVELGMVERQMESARSPL